MNYIQVPPFKDEVMISETFLLHIKEKNISPSGTRTVFFFFLSDRRKHTDDIDFHAGVVLLHLL